MRATTILTGTTLATFLLILGCGGGSATVAMDGDASAGASGSAARGTSSAGEGGGTAEGEAVTATLLIDDGDDGDAETQLGGIWLSYDDSRNGGESVIEPLTDPFPDGPGFELTAPGLGGEGYAAKIEGETGAVLGYDYAGLTVTLAESAFCPTPTEVDVSEWGGIRFRAKGSIVGDAELRVVLPFSADSCEDGEQLPSSLTGYGDFQIDIAPQLEQDWTTFELSFRRDFTQPGWQFESETFDIEEVIRHLKQVNWHIEGPGAAFEVWIDDVELYEDSKPPVDYPYFVVPDDVGSIWTWDADTPSCEAPCSSAVATSSLVEPTGGDLDEAIRVQVAEATEEVWGAGAGQSTTAEVRAGDVLFEHFWIRCAEPLAETGACQVEFGFNRQSPPWTSSLATTLRVPSDWTEIQVPFVAAESYGPAEATAVFSVGHGAQILEIAGLTVTNYGQTVTVDDLPRSLGATYPGREPAAAWRDAADSRIEEHRQGDLTVTVEDGSGQPIPDAEVEVAMIRHAFGFGTAISANEMRNGFDEATLSRYQQEVASLFNTVTLENALKWQALAGDWGENFDLELAEWAVDWANSEGLDVRGHVLVWPGWDNLPIRLQTGYEERVADDEVAALDWLAAEVVTHVDDMATAMGGRLVHWDVLNEPADNQDLMDLLGDEAMVDWFAAARAADPGAKLFINDYGILTGGTSPNSHRDHYLGTIEYLLDRGAELDGIGLQGHFGSRLAPPEELLELLDQFSELGPELWVTEFDMDQDDEALAADYLRDLLTVLYSHPSVGGFVMWGFRGDDRPIYEDDWTLKPSGQTYIDLVLDEWWTDETGITDDTGSYAVRGFTGDYLVTVRHDGLEQTRTPSLDTDGAELTVVLE